MERLKYSGVTVELEDTSGHVLSTTTTDASGAYHFTGLAPRYVTEVPVRAPDRGCVDLGDAGQRRRGPDSNADRRWTSLTAPVDADGRPRPTTRSRRRPGNEARRSAAARRAGGVIKLRCEVVVGTCGQVTYTYDVTDAGSMPVSSVNIIDDVGTAANQNDVTPNAVTSNGCNVGDANQDGVHLDFQARHRIYQNTINQSGDYSSKSSSAHCSVSGQNLGSGCTTWFNSSFTPTSCKDGATYRSRTSPAR